MTSSIPKYDKVKSRKNNKRATLVPRRPLTDLMTITKTSLSNFQAIRKTRPAAHKLLRRRSQIGEYNQIDMKEKR